MTNIYITRHSEKEKNYTFISGGEDIRKFNYLMPLSEEGERRAKILSELDCLKNITNVYSSNFSRTIATAKYTANKYNKKIKIIEELAERDMGINTLSELPENFEKRQMEDHNYKYGNGESLNDAGNRLKRVIKDLLRDEKGNDILVVTHAAILMSYFFIMGYETSNKIKLNGKTIIPLNYDWKSPDLFKLEFDDSDELINIEHILLKY